MRDTEPVPSGDVPWTANDVINVTLRAGFALVLLLVGWVGASGEGAVSPQLKWIDCGVTGVIVAGVAGGHWQLVGLRRVRQRQAELLGTAQFRESRRRPMVAASRGITSRAPYQTSAIATYSAPGMAKYHRADCPLLRGKLADIVAAEGGGLNPCGICSP